MKAMDEDKGEFWKKILKSAIVDLFINEKFSSSNLKDIQKDMVKAKNDILHFSTSILICPIL
mgnify:CR=1 FL=1